MFLLLEPRCFVHLPVVTSYPLQMFRSTFSNTIGELLMINESDHVPWAANAHLKSEIGHKDYQLSGLTPKDVKSLIKIQRPPGQRRPFDIDSHPGQRPPWTETSPDRDPPDRDPPDRDPLDREPLDRGPPRQRPPRQRPPGQRPSRQRPSGQRPLDKDPPDRDTPRQQTLGLSKEAVLAFLTSLPSVKISLNYIWVFAGIVLRTFHEYYEQIWIN